MGRLMVPQPEPALASSLMFSCSIAPGHIAGSEEPAPAAARRSRNELKVDVDGLASLLAPVTSAKVRWRKPVGPHRRPLSFLLDLCPRGATFDTKSARPHRSSQDIVG